MLCYVDLDGVQIQEVTATWSPATLREAVVQHQFNGHSCAINKNFPTQWSARVFTLTKKAPRSRPL